MGDAVRAPERVGDARQRQRTASMEP